MADEARKVVKLRLNDGNVYSIFDTDAMRINDQGKLITGNLIIDNILINQNKFIIEIDDMPVEQAADFYLVQEEGESVIKRKRRTDVLKDIGGASYEMDGTTGVLRLYTGLPEED